MKIALRLIPVLSGLVLLIAMATYFFARPTTDWIVDRVLGHLHEPADFELPVTVVEYRSSPNMIASIGGRGQGLDCSIPAIARIAFSNVANSAPIELQFRQACVFHDLCYRHGLATYGYMQADCDYLLQEQAFRICRALQHASIDACRRRAKKVLLGVRIGGFKPFHSWESSTYHEFDPMPKRSVQFYANRLAAKDGTSARGGPLDLLTFTISRSAATVRCRTCGPRANAVQAPGAHTDFLPLGVFAAPQLVTAPGRAETFVWFNRTAEENTDLRINTMKWRHGVAIFGNWSPSSDLFASTVYPTLVPSDLSPAALALSVQNAFECNATLAFRIIRMPQHRGRCVELPDFLGGPDAAVKLVPPHRDKDFYRFFQHPLLIDRESTTAMMIKRGEDDTGSNYRNRALLVTADYSAEATEKTKLRLYPNQPVEERHEPVSLLSLENKEPRLLSMMGVSSDSETATDRPEASCRDTARIMELPVANSPTIAWMTAGLSSMRGREVSGLPVDWIHRPPLVVRDPTNDHRPSMVFTRARALRSDHPPYSVAVEIFKARRSLEHTPGWVVDAVGRLSVEYRNKGKQGVACLQIQDGRMMASLRLPGGQTLADDIAGEGRLSIVLTDPCLTSAPIILEEKDGRYHLHSEATPRKPVEQTHAEDYALAREVRVEAFDERALSEPLDTLAQCPRLIQRFGYLTSGWIEFSKSRTSIAP